MSERNRSEQPKDRRLVASIFLAGLICSAIWFVYGDIQRKERGKAASEHQNKSFVECVSTSGLVDAPACLKKALYPPYEKSTEYYDLKAQQEMARWALLMLAVTAVGVLYVAVTLKEAASATLAAQDAVRVTREMGEAQTRAYLGIETIQFTDFATGKIPKCVCVLKNFGQSPASEVQYTSALYWTERKATGKTFRIFNNQWTPIGPMPPSHSHTTEIPFDKKLDEGEFRQALGTGKWLHLVLYVTYRDFTKRRRRLLIHSYADSEQARRVREYHMLKHRGHNRST